MNNARRQDRVDCDIILNKFESGATNICRATDISLGGMQLQRLLEPFRFDNPSLRLEIELPGDHEPLLIGATRVWDDDASFGVRFVDISHQHFVRLRAWLQEQDMANDLPDFKVSLV